MLKLSLNRLAYVRGIRLTWGWFRKKGFSHWVAAKLMKGNAPSLCFRDMERLCLAFKCTPNDLFSWVPPKGTPESRIATYSLHVLNRNNDLAYTIGELTHEQLMEIAKAIKEQEAKE